MQQPTNETLRLVERSATFKAAVDAAAAAGKAIVADLDAFADDPLALYAALEYARWRGVDVTFAAGGPAD